MLIQYIKASVVTDRGRGAHFTPGKLYGKTDVPFNLYFGFSFGFQ